MTADLIPLPGNKAGLAQEQKNYLPSHRFTKSWESNAGTLAFSNIVLSGLELDEMYATELDKGTYNLLKQTQENPYALTNYLMDVEYSEEIYNWADSCLEKEYEGMTQLEIAAARYILGYMSYNGIVGDNYRDIDKGKEDFDCFMSGQWYREKFKRQILKIPKYSKGLQGIKLIHGDMIDYFDRFATDPEFFIYADIPYENSLRANGLYQVETSTRWHRDFAIRLASMTRDKTLRASVMLCGYVNKDLKSDVYVKQLLAAGWQLLFIKETNRPTILKENVKDRKHKGKAIEAIFINYEPINPLVGKERIFNYYDVFGNKK